MKRTAMLLMFLGGCAATGGEVKTGGYCSIAESSWAGADRDFDRATTLEQLRALEGAASADRDKLKAGAKADVGDSLDHLFRQPAPQGFVGRGVAELGNRLRQLDCAVRADRVTYDLALDRYGRILGELGAERATLDPGAGTPRASSP
jgi:hypothetical protein